MKMWLLDIFNTITHGQFMLMLLKIRNTASELREKLAAHLKQNNSVDSQWQNLTEYNEYYKIL
jgi:hypothetical protein